MPIEEISSIYIVRVAGNPEILHEGTDRGEAFDFAQALFDANPSFMIVKVERVIRGLTLDRS